jgi:hypothetical protein
MLNRAFITASTIPVANVPGSPLKVDSLARVAQRPSL